MSQYEKIDHARLHTTAFVQLYREKAASTSYKSVLQLIAIVIIMFAAVIFAFVVIFAAIAITMVSPETCLDVLVWYFLPDNSLDPAGRIHMFYLHPSNVDIVTMMFATLPTLVLVDMLLSTRTYLGKFFVAVTWVVSLFVLEEIFLIELLPPELFVACLHSPQCICLPSLESPRSSRLPSS